MMQTLGNWLSQPQTVWIFVASLIILAACCALSFEKELRSVSLKLRQALGLLWGVNSPREFAATFESTCNSMRTLFQRDRALLEQWYAFEQGTLLYDNRICSQREAEVFFTSSKLLKRHAILRYRTISGVLVGLGLIATFLGLAVVIYQASVALGDAGDPTALRNLLATASLKFWTSLSGVALSLMCAHHCRTRLQSFSLDLGRFTNKLSYLAPVAGPQRLLDEMAGLRHDLGTIGERTLSGLQERITAVLGDAVAGSIGNMAAPVGELNASLDALREKLDLIAAQVTGTCTSLKEATTAFGTAVGESGQQLRQDFSEVATSGTKMRQSFADAAEDAEQTWKSLNRLSSMTGKLNEAMTALSRLDGVPETLTSTSKALRESAENIAGVWKGHVGRVEHLDQQLASTLTHLPVVFDQYARALQSYTSDLDTHLTTTLNRLMEWVERIESLQHGSRPASFSSPAAVATAATVEM